MVKQPVKKNNGGGNKRLSLWLRILFVGLAGFFLIISASAGWFNRYIFATDNFTSTTSQAILSDSSRQAMADEITDRLLANKPLLKSVADDRVQKLIAALLGTDLSQIAVNKAVTLLQTTITSNNPKSVAIDLTGIKTTITNVLGVIRNQTNRSPDAYRVDPADIPDQVVLLDASKIPNIYTLGIVMMWLGPLTLMAAFVLLGLVLYRDRSSKLWLKQTLVLEAIVVLLAGIIARLLGPLFKPLVLGPVTNPNVRIVIENIYNAFIGHFNGLVVVIFILGFLLLGAALILYLSDHWHRTATKTGKR